MKEEINLSEKISAGTIQWITENLQDLIFGGIGLDIILIISGVILFFIFSKAKNPISVKAPLIISFIFGLLFSSGFTACVILPFYMKTKVWNEFMTGGIVLSFFVFVGFAMVLANYFGKKALGEYADRVSEDGIILGIRNMPDGSTAINPKWFQMGWSSLFTNALCLGAIGSGKTSAVLLKVMQQILLMKKKKPAAFVLDIKGDLYETVRLWHHPRQKDLVCYGYGYEPVNILGNENILKTVNNLSKGFESLNEAGSKVSYYLDKQKDYLQIIIKLLRFFVARPEKDKTNAYLFNKYIKYRSEYSESMWSVFTIGTSLPLIDISKNPPLKEQEITLNTKLFLEEMGENGKNGLIMSDDFTIADIFSLVSEVPTSKSLYLFCKQYLEVLKKDKKLHESYLKYDEYPKFQSALSDYASFVFDKDFDKNISGLKSPLSTLSDESISRFFNARGKTVDFQKDIDAGKIIFVNVPEGDVGSEVARLIGIQFLFQYTSTLNRRNSILSEVSKDKPVFILIDEFFKFINKEIMNFTSTSRSARSINILLGQSLGQFPEEYKEALKSNLRTKMVFSIGDEVTAEAMSRYLGEHMTVRKSRSKSYGANQSSGQSESDQSDRKIKPHELIELAPFHAAVSHYDGSKTVPAEIISFPAWFVKGYNIFPTENFIFAFSRVIKKDEAKTFLNLIRKTMKSRGVKISDITLHKNTIFFTLSYFREIDENAVDFILKHASKVAEYQLDRFACSYDEVLDKKRKLQIPKPNVIV